MFWHIREERKVTRSLNSLGTTWEVTPEMFIAIQKFACVIYGTTKKTIKHKNQNKIVADHIASIWK